MVGTKKMETLVKEPVVVEEVENVTRIIEGDDSSAWKNIVEMHPYWKCCNDILYVFDDITEMWSDKVDIKNNIISR